MINMSFYFYQSQVCFCYFQYYLHRTPFLIENKTLKFIAIIYMFFFLPIKQFLLLPGLQFWPLSRWDVTMILFCKPKISFNSHFLSRTFILYCCLFCLRQLRNRDNNCDDNDDNNDEGKYGTNQSDNLAIFLTSRCKRYIQQSLSVLSVDN